MPNPKTIKEIEDKLFDDLIGYLDWDYKQDEDKIRKVLSSSLISLLEEERNRIYSYVEERLIGNDNELLVDLSNIIFDKELSNLKKEIN